MDEFEKRLSILLEELINKRSELENLHKKYDVEQVCMREMNEEIEKLKTERKNLKMQIEFTNKALHKCEDNFGSSRDSAVKYKLNLEAATKTIEAMKEQAVNMHSEKVKLKRQIEELEKNKQAELSFKEASLSKQGKTNSCVEALVGQVRDLEKDLKNLDLQIKDTVLLGKKNNLLIEHKDATIRQMKSKTEELSQQLVCLSSENRVLKDNAEERRTIDQHQNCTPDSKILQEWKTAQSEMKRRMASWEAESEILNQTLQNALEAQVRFQKLEQAANDRSKMLETKVQELQRALQKSQTDCSVQTDLTILIDVACGTERGDAEVEVTSVHTQTEDKYSTASELRKDRSMPLDNPIQEVSSDHQKGPKFDAPPDCSTNKDESLSSMISRLHQEINYHSQDMYELPTQINIRNNYI